MKLHIDSIIIFGMVIAAGILYVSVQTSLNDYQRKQVAFASYVNQVRDKLPKEQLKMMPFDPIIEEIRKNREILPAYLNGALQGIIVIALLAGITFVSFLYAKFENTIEIRLRKFEQAAESKDGEFRKVSNRIDVLRTDNQTLFNTANDLRSRVVFIESVPSVKSHQSMVEASKSITK